MALYIAKIQGYYEDGEKYHDMAIIAAEDMCSAVMKMLEYWGDENTCKLTIEPAQDGGESILWGDDLAQFGKDAYDHYARQQQTEATESC